MNRPLKTNKTNKKVCPSNCGQPGNETFDRYFRHLYDDPKDTITYQKFKKLCLEKSHLMMPIYVANTFECDYLLWLYFEDSRKEYRIFNKENIVHFQWNKADFSFTKDLQSWNESCTVKYRGVTLGEYQVHSRRNNYKFRFNFDNLCILLGL
jgi:hypothetical protein